jgi:Holliday junction DNA helicase RuvB
MARERLVSAAEQAADTEQSVGALRPGTIGEYVGQRELIERIRIAIEAARSRAEPMEHVLLHGPPGLGKTTRAYVTSGPALTKAADLIGTLTKMQANDVLFIDEIHRLPTAVEEYIYPAMEDFRIDFTVDSGMHSKVVTIGLRPFTLIGATTRAGLLTQALRSRFGIAHNLGFYPVEDLVAIIDRAARLMKMPPLPAETLSSIAERSRGTPRVALRLLRRVRDFSAVRAGGRQDADVVDRALALEGVDELGLDELDRRYLRALGTTYAGGPAGLEAIAASVGEDAQTLEDVVEPYLLQVGYLARTRQGRRMTDAAFRHVGLTPPARAEALFD